MRALRITLVAGLSLAAVAIAKPGVSQTAGQSPAQPPNKITRPKPTYTPTPAYPEGARKGGVEGTVSLHLTVGADGKTHDIVVTHGLTPELNEAAIQGVSQWRFKPATKDGQPIADDIYVQVSFSKFR